MMLLMRSAAAGAIRYFGRVDRRSLLLAGLVSLTGCVRNSAVEPPQLVVDAVPDESILQALFEPGTKFELTVGGQSSIVLREVGLLSLPTGSLIAADPSWLPGWQRLGIAPYTAAVRPGKYPVLLSVMSSQGVDLVAAAKLSITSNSVASWSLALRPGENLQSLQTGEYFGVGVDVGNAGFLDAAALKYMAEREAASSGELNVLAAQLSTQRTEPVTGANYIVFNTGYGDGHYPVWVGRDAGGVVVCFVMDMLIARLPQRSRP